MGHSGTRYRGLADRYLPHSADGLHVMGAAVEFIAVIGAVAWATVTLAWSAIWLVLYGLFWLAVIILVGFFSTIVLWPELLASRRGITAPETSASTIEAIRRAPRPGALDGEIARINARNGARKSV